MNPCGFPLLSITSAEVLLNCKNFKSRDDLPTIFITSYPKSGTTWMQNIVYQLLTKGQRARDLDHISYFTPFYEIPKIWVSNQVNGELTQPYRENQLNIFHHHAFNTHLLYHMLPHHSENIKFIYIMRNCKDVAVSFYHHLSNQNDEDNYSNPFSEYFKDFFSGTLIYGAWINHIKDFWISSKNDSSIYLVQYQDLINQPLEELTKISSFLKLDLTKEEILENILPSISFSYMKENKKKFEPISVPWKQGFEFIRKGQVGDHKSLFTDIENKLYNEWKEKLYNSYVSDVDKEFLAFLEFNQLI